MKACIFLDIDGTLLDHEIGIQESSRIAIAQAQANGHRVCLATGRPKPEVDDEIQAIPFDGLPDYAENTKSFPLPHPQPAFPLNPQSQSCRLHP